MTNIYNSAVTNINNAASVEAIETVVDTAKAEMDAVEKIDKLADAKANAIAELTTYFETFSEENYSEDNWAELVGYYNDGKASINAATSQEEITAALTTAKSNMDSVEVEVDLTEDKDLAIAELTSYYQTFDRVNYTSANWDLLTNIFETAKSDIEEATSLSEITELVETAKTAMNNVDVRPEAGETLEILAVDFYNVHYVRFVTNQYTHLLKQGAEAIEVVDADLDTAKYFEGPYPWGEYENATFTIQALNYDLTQVQSKFKFKINFADDTYQYVYAMIVDGELKNVTYVRELAISKLDGLIAEHGLIEEKYTSENWALFQDTLAGIYAEINKTIEYDAFDQIIDDGMLALLEIPQKELTLEEVKAFAIDELEAYLQTKNEEEYSSENWEAILDAVNDGKDAINAAETKEDVEAALDAAKDAIDSVTKLPKPLSISFWNPHGGIFVQFGWANAITNAEITNAVATIRDIATGTIYQGTFDRNDGDKNKFFTFDYQVEVNEYEFNIKFYVGSEIYEATIEVRGKEIKSLEIEKGLAIQSLDDFMSENGIVEAKYTDENWLLVQLTLLEGKENIEKANSFDEIRAIVASTKDEILSIEQKDLDLESAKVLAIEELEALLLSKNQADYSSENWAQIETLFENAFYDINAAESIEEVNTIKDNAKLAINNVSKLPKELVVGTWNPHGGVFLQFGWTNEFTNTQVTDKTVYVKDLNTGVITNGVFDRIVGTKEMVFKFDGYTIDASGSNVYEIVITLKVGSEVYEYKVECKAGARISLVTEKQIAINSLENYPASKGYVEAKYTPENWDLLQLAIQDGKAAINAATSYLEVIQALEDAKAVIDSIEQTVADLSVLKDLAIQELQNLKASKKESDYTPDNWDLLLQTVQNGIDAINAAETEEDINLALDTAKDAINTIPKLTLPINTVDAPWNPHGVNHIVVGWNNSFTNNDIETYYAELKDLLTETVYVGKVLHDDGAKAKFFQFIGYNVEDPTCHYEFTLRLTLKTGEIYETTFEVIGRVKQGA